MLDGFDPDTQRKISDEVDPLFGLFLQMGLAAAMTTQQPKTSHYGVHGPGCVCNPHVLLTIYPDGKLAIGMLKDEEGGNIEEAKAWIAPILGPTWWAAIETDPHTPWSEAAKQAVAPAETIELPAWLASLNLSVLAEES